MTWQTHLLCQSLHFQKEHSMHSHQNNSTSYSRAAGTRQRGLPVHAILLGAGAQQAQHPPVMKRGGGVVSQADQVVVALLLGALQPVLQAVEARPRPHAGAAACLALPLLHPGCSTARLHPRAYPHRCQSPVDSDEPRQQHQRDHAKQNHCPHTWA